MPRRIRQVGFVPATIAACAFLLLFVAALHALDEPATVSGQDQIVPHELIAQVGGAINVMRITDDILWMGLGPRVVAVDIGAPSNAKIIGRTPVLGGEVLDVAVSGVEPNAFGGEPAAAWVLVGNRTLVGLDLTNPTAPVVLSSTMLADPATDIALVDHCVWLASRHHGIRGYDITDPSSPKAVGDLRFETTEQTAPFLAAVDGHVVVGFSSDWLPEDTAIILVDVRDPLQPRRVGRIVPASVGGWRVHAMSLTGDTVWVLDRDDDALRSIDVSDPTSPTLLAEIVSADFYLPSRLTLGNDRAYVTGGDGGHNYYVTAVVDVSDPISPTLVGSGDLPRTSDPMNGMAAAGGHFWYGTSDGSVFGLGGLAPPSRGWGEIGHVLTTGPAIRHRVQDGVGITALREAVLVSDLSWPRQPRPLTTTLVHSYPDDIATSTDLAYVVTGGEMDVLGGSIRVVDLSDPSAPSEDPNHRFQELSVRRMSTAGDTGVMISRLQPGSHLEPSQAVILDLGVPKQPTRLGALSERAGLGAALISGDLLLATTPDRPTSEQPEPVELVVADLTLPDRPVRLGSITLTPPLQDIVSHIAAAGGTAFVISSGTLTGGSNARRHLLSIVDVTVGASPTLRAEMPLPSRPDALTYAHGYVLVGFGNGVRMYDVSDPRAPVDVGGLPIGAAGASDVFVDDGLVYASAGTSGLWIFAPRMDGWPPSAVPSTPPPTVATTTTTPSPTRQPSPTPTASRRPVTWSVVMPFAVCP